MMEIRPLQKGDIEYVKVNPLEGAVKNYPDIPVDPKTSYTALWDGKIVGVFGILIMWKGVGELWLILTKDSNRKGAHGLVALDIIRKKVDEIIKDNNIVRAQATVRVDFPKGIQMLVVLGFEVEGRLRKYTPDGCDVYRFARII